MSELADTLERFRRGAEILAVATTGVAGSMADFRPSEKAWSVRQIVCHITDVETMLVLRLRQMIAEEEPELRGFDGEAWAERLDYHKRKISHALETFRILRTENHLLLKDLPEEAFARAGRHVVMGRMTLLDVLKHGAEHVESHVGQIMRTREAYKEQRAKQAQAQTQPVETQSAS